MVCLTEYNRVLGFNVSDTNLCEILFACIVFFLRMPSPFEDGTAVFTMSISYLMKNLFCKMILIAFEPINFGLSFRICTFFALFHFEVFAPKPTMVTCYVHNAIIR